MEGLSGHQARAFRQIPGDGVGFPESRAVGQHQIGNDAQRIDADERLPPRFSAQDIDEAHVQFQFQLMLDEHGFDAVSRTSGNVKDGRFFCGHGDFLLSNPRDHRGVAKRGVYPHRLTTTSFLHPTGRASWR
jgi:hypothetical protein